jgi:predicted enzyme related to lactoylglutathione lyase
MPERSEHAPGTPSWVDIGTDVEGAKAFYRPLFGWDAMEAGPPEETGGYGFFTKNGKMVAGYGPQQNPGPPFWSSYVAVDDADQATKRVEAAGGTVVVAAMDVMDAGRMAVYQDNQGAVFSVWQPGNHRGAQVVGEAGALSWTELNTRDVEAAKRFYPDVFGWEPQTSEGPMPYTEFKLGGESVCGCMPMPDAVPADVPPHWLVYFGADDVDATVARVQELGGIVRMPGMDFPSGRFAVVADPQEATFGVLKLNG